MRQIDFWDSVMSGLKCACLHVLLKLLTDFWDSVMSGLKCACLHVLLKLLNRFLGQCNEWTKMCMFTCAVVEPAPSLYSHCIVVLLCMTGTCQNVQIAILRGGGGGRLLSISQEGKGMVWYNMDRRREHERGEGALGRNTRKMG
jgi:hypothetical protein